MSCQLPAELAFPRRGPKALSRILAIISLVAAISVG
jgi:hypothetical protein